MIEVFLKQLVAELRQRYPQLQDHKKIKWLGHPEVFWPQADILIDTSTRRFIIEDDNDCDPVRSIIKYWPIIDANKELTLTIIGIFKRGTTIGEGFMYLAEWTGEKFMVLYTPRFAYRLIDRKDESPIAIAKRVTQIVDSQA